MCLRFSLLAFKRVSYRFQLLAVKHPRLQEKSAIGESHTIPTTTPTRNTKNKNAFQSKAHRPLADRKSNNYNFGGGGYPAPPSQVLPAVLPSLSFGGDTQALPAVLSSWSFQVGFPGLHSQVLPAVLPSWSFGGGGGGLPGPSFPGPSQLVLPGASM